MIEVFAALALSTAAGMRIALPLLLIGLLRSGELWANMPLLSHIPPRIVLGVLVSWSGVELFLSKGRLGQRVLQMVQLVCSPFVGAIVGIAVARTALFPGWFTALIGIVGGLIAFVLQLVQIGWFYRLRGLPVWMIFVQDFLCVLLVLLAFDAPTQGGLIALLLLWLMIRSSVGWRKWYQAQAKPSDRRNPRRYKQDPD